MKAVRKDLFESGSKVITSTRSILSAGVIAVVREGEGVRLESDRLALRKRGLDASLFSSGLYLRGLVENRGLSQEEIDGVGDAGMAMLSGIGLGGMGDGSCQRCKFVGKKIYTTRTKCLTLNDKLCALGVITVISCAVEALWRAFAGLANDTLPTRTLWTTVLYIKNAELR